MGVAENESASVSFKIKIASGARSIATSTRNSKKISYIVVSIKDAETKKVIASKILPGDATSYTVIVIPIDLTVIGKIEFFYDNISRTFRSLSHTITYGRTIL